MSDWSGLLGTRSNRTRTQTRVVGKNQSIPGLESARSGLCVLSLLELDLASEGKSPQ